MATFYAENTLREFNAALDELETSISFVRAAVRLRPRLNDWLRWEAMETDAKTLVTNYISQKGFEPSAFYRGVVIVLSGAFEQMVRRLLQEFVVRLNETAENYDSLGETIKLRNALHTGRALATIAEPPDHLEADYVLLAKNIGTCVPGATDFVLNAPAFTFFVSSITPPHLEEVLKRIGVQLDWDDLEAIPPCKRYLRKLRHGLPLMLHTFIWDNLVRHETGSPIRAAGELLLRRQKLIVS